MLSGRLCSTVTCSLRHCAASLICEDKRQSSINTDNAFTCQCEQVTTKTTLQWLALMDNSLVALLDSAYMSSEQPLSTD